MNNRLVNEKFAYLTGVAYSAKHRNPLRIKDKRVVNNMILVHSYITAKVRYDIDLEKYICNLTYSELVSYTGLSQKQVVSVMKKFREYEIVNCLYSAANKNESSIYEYVI